VIYQLFYNFKRKILVHIFLKMFQFLHHHVGSVLLSVTGRDENVKKIIWIMLMCERNTQFKDPPAFLTH